MAGRLLVDAAPPVVLVDIEPLAVDASPKESRLRTDRFVAAHRAANPLGRPAPPGIPVSPILDNAPDGTWPFVLPTVPDKADDKIELLTPDA